MNILIVDDLEVNLRLLRAQLEAEGFIVLEAADGLAALEILNREKVDVIISDILMPRMDGYHLCTEIRKNEKFATLPFIVYTATYTSPSDEKLSLELGADYFLRKPASVAEIKQTIKAVTSEQRRHSPQSIRGTDDITVMKEYNTALVGKLEQKLVELEETQKGLAASEERYRRIVETAEEGIWTIDAQERTTYVNPKVASIFGYSTEEMMAGSFYDFMPKASARLARAGMKRRRIESLTNNFDFKFRRKDGSDFWALVASKPIFNEGGEYIGSLAMITDIDDRKKSEEKLLASEKQKPLPLPVRPKEFGPNDCLAQH
jgi:PAS domain S-box-containing protein